MFEASIEGRLNMARYAENTSVDSGRSRNEIERTLARYGATSFMYGWDAGQALVGFIAQGRQVRFLLPMPARDDKKFTRTPTGRTRSKNQAEQAYEQAVRQAWRALSLVIKAKLEAVEAGIVSFDEEFAMHYVLPNGQTFGQWATPQINHVYETGEMPPMLPATQQKELT